LRGLVHTISNQITCQEQDENLPGFYEDLSGFGYINLSRYVAAGAPFDTPFRAVRTGIAIAHAAKRQS